MNMLVMGITLRVSSFPYVLQKYLSIMMIGEAAKLGKKYNIEEKRKSRRILEYRRIIRS